MPVWNARRGIANHKSFGTLDQLLPLGRHPIRPAARTCHRSKERSGRMGNVSQERGNQGHVSEAQGKAREDGQRMARKGPRLDGAEGWAKEGTWGDEHEAL